MYRRSEDSVGVMRIGNGQATIGDLGGSTVMQQRVSDRIAWADWSSIDDACWDGNAPWRRSWASAPCSAGEGGPCPPSSVLGWLTAVNTEASFWIFPSEGKSAGNVAGACLVVVARRGHENGRWSCTRRLDDKYRPRTLKSDRCKAAR